MQESLSRKERERIFKRQEIMNAAIKIFAEKGFSASTLDEIAVLSEFGKGTLYNYFTGKEEIYTEIIYDVIKNIQEMVNKSDSESDSTSVFLEKYTSSLVNYCLSHPEAFLIFVREVSQLNTEYMNIKRDNMLEKFNGINQVLMKRFEKGIKSKEIKKFSPEKLVAMYNHMVFPYIHHMIICPDFNLEEKEETKFIISVLFNGIINK